VPAERRETVAPERALICAPTGRDASLTCEVLAASGIDCRAFASCDQLIEAVSGGAGVVILGQEALEPDEAYDLASFLARQPVWSDLPVIILVRDDDDVRETVASLGPVANVTLLERPVHLATLLSAVQTALRARRRQYEVRDLVQRLAETDRHKDEFLALLGHELRNPLAAVAAAAEILARSDVATSVRRQQTVLVRRQVRHLTRMVDDLLDLSRLSMGRIDILREALDLRSVVEHALEALDLAGRNGFHRLVVDLPEEPLPILGDPIRLEQVVSNLLRNAIKYTPEAQGIEVAARRLGDRVEIRVRDEGVGIEEKDLESIFDPFTQGTRARHVTEGGLGMGLYLSRRLVELHDGTIEARSDGTGTGAEVIVRLPLFEQGERPTPEAVAEDRSEGTAAGNSLLPEGVSVLLVEDNPGGREALEALLDLWGCLVTTASTGAEAIECGVGRPPKVALVDIGLPDIDGYEVARRLRQELGDGCCRLVALTGFGQPEDRRRALDAGFDEHLVKPVDPGRLSALLRQAGSA